MINSNRFFFGCLLFLALCSVLYLFKSFLLNIFIAALLAVATSNINVKILSLTKNRQTLAAGLTTAALFLLFIAPLAYTIMSVAKYASTFNMDNATSTIEYIKNYDLQLPESLAFLKPNVDEFMTDLDIKALFTKAIGNVANLGKLSLAFLADMVIILVFFFFCNLFGAELVRYIKQVLPMKPSDTEFILSEVANVMSVVFYSTIVNMILQGSLFAIITMMYGYDGFFTGILFGFCSLIPVVGGLIAWGPISLYEFSQGNAAGAIVIALYTLIMISVIADTFLKPIVIKFINDRLVKIPTKINELLIFFAMIAGIATFGFWGVILGPAIVTFFISTIKLYVLLRERSIV